MVEILVSPARQAEAYDQLLGQDPVLRKISAAYGRPDPFAWDDGGRTTGSKFAAMLLHIVSQQISTKVAFALFDRIHEAAGGTAEPLAIVALGPERIHALGVSRAKASYVVGLAQMQLSGVLDVNQLDELNDEDAVRTLTAARGVGQWTAEMFLIAQLHREDILPAGDLGIRHAVMAAGAFPALPTIDEVRAFGAAWTPLRTYAATLLWASLRPGH